MKDEAWMPDLVASRTLDIADFRMQESVSSRALTGRIQLQPTRRHPIRTVLIRLGIALSASAGLYLGGGLLGLLPMDFETLSIINVRIVAGVAILGCLMAAVGYGQE